MLYPFYMIMPELKRDRLKLLSECEAETFRIPGFSLTRPPRSRRHKSLARHVAHHHFTGRHRLPPVADWPADDIGCEPAKPQTYHSRVFAFGSPLDVPAAEHWNHYDLQRASLTGPHLLVSDKGATFCKLQRPKPKLYKLTSLPTCHHQCDGTGDLSLKPKTKAL